MAELASLSDAVSSLVHDGDTLALEGFTHLVPFAAGHEIIRQGIRDLELVRLTPDLIYDQMIGAGVARKLVFSWGGNPGVGSLHRLRDAVENGYPAPLSIEEYSHFELASRYVAGASGLPFVVTRGASRTDLHRYSPGTLPMACPFTGTPVTAVRALNPDVAVIHAQRADRRGNVQMWGITGVQKEAVLAAGRSLVTVEEIVDELTPVPGAVILPSWCVTMVAEAPRGAAPSYALGYYERDNGAYVKWEETSRDRAAFEHWLRQQILNGGSRGT